VQHLLEAGVEFRDSLDDHFDGTTLFGTNKEAQRFNALRLRELQGEAFVLNSWRWGIEDVRKRPPREWKLVPDQLPLKVGAYVMVLVNDLPKFRYVNGSCGYITKFNSENGTVRVKLASGGRVGDEFSFPRICRPVERNHPPEDIKLELLEAGRAAKGREDATANEARAAVMHKYAWALQNGKPRPTTVHFDRQREKWVHGALYYTPLRPAWATTVHKSQGLTLDRVQLDCRAWFFGKPAMAYVALSRCKTPEGLVVVGSPEMLAKKVKVDPRVMEWL
jgi:hypothetical protein